MRKIISSLTSGITVLLVLFIVFACTREKEDINTSTTVRVKRGDIINYIKATGRIESVKESIVRSEINARIKKVFVKEGDIVKTGDLIVSFEPDSINLTGLELDIKAKETAYKQTLINKEQAEREFDISKELYKIQAEALVNLETKEGSLRKAQNALLQTEEELEHATIKLESISRKMQCISPQNGIVISKEVKEGESVVSGQALITVADIEHLQISADVDEVDAGRVKVGHEAIITSDALPEKQFKAYVSRIYPGATIKGERTVVETILKFNDNPIPLKINSHVDVKIITDKKESALLLPLLAVSWENDNSFVWVKQNESVKKVFIKTGTADFNSIEILSGLKEGDEIVIKSHGK